MCATLAYPLVRETGLDNLTVASGLGEVNAGRAGTNELKKEAPMRYFRVYRCTAKGCCCGQWVIIRHMNGRPTPVHIKFK